MRRGAKVEDFEDEFKCNALLMSCQYGHTEIVKIILESGANAECRKFDGKTPLIIACQENFLEMAKLLIENNADVEATFFGYSPLHVALQNGHLEMARLLIQNQANVNHINDGYRTMLHTVFLYYEDKIMVESETRQKTYEMVKLLIDYGCNVNAEGGRELEGVTALHHACRFGLNEIVEMLIRNNANVFVKWDSEGYLPKDAALITKYYDLHHKMSEFEKAILNMHKAVKTGNKNFITEIVNQNEISIDCNNKIGFNPLMTACSKNNCEMVRFLISNHANVNHRSRKDSTALHIACFKGNLDIATMLIDNGANVNARKMDGSTPLHYAVSQGHVSIVELLIRNGAFVNARTESGKSALFFARENEDIIVLLVGNGAVGTD